LTVAVNRLQSEKIVVDDGRDLQASRDPIASTACHGHKLLFPTYDGSEDPLPWLNRCEQFFRIQKTEEAGKVFLAAFYMTGDAAQWYALVERNHDGRRLSESILGDRQPLHWPQREAAD
jgi:hypothetical protein